MGWDPWLDTGSGDNGFIVTFFSLSLFLFLHVVPLCLFFPSDGLSCAAVPVILLLHVGKKQRRLDNRPTFLSLKKKKKKNKRKEKKENTTSINKCDHVQRGGPPHLSWIQAAQASNILLHPYPSRCILIPPGSLILTAVLQQTPWNPGEHAWPQDSERLWKRAHGAL